MLFNKSPIFAHPIISALLSTLLIAVFSHSSAANSSSQLDDLNAQKQIAEDRVARYLDDLEKAQQAVDDIQPEVFRLFSDAKSNPSDETARAATLIAIDYNRLLARVERTEKRVSDNQEKLAAIESKITEKAQDIALAARLEEELAAARRKAETEAKAKAQPKPQPVKPVKIAETPTASTPQKTPEKPRATSEPVVVINAAKNTVSVKQPAPVKSASPAPKALEKQAKVVEESGNWPSFNNASTADKLFVENQLKEAKQALVDGDKPSLPKVVVRARRSFGNRTMTYLGNDLYALEAPISSGSQQFGIFNKKFWLNVPESEDQKNYYFVFDATSLANPQLFAFRAEVAQ